MKDQREAVKLLKEQLQNYESIDDENTPKIPEQKTSPPRRSRERSVNTASHGISNRVSFKKSEKEVVPSPIASASAPSLPTSLFNLVKVIILI